MNTLYPVRVLRPCCGQPVGAVFTPAAAARDVLLARGMVVKHEPAIEAARRRRRKIDEANGVRLDPPA